MQEATQKGGAAEVALCALRIVAAFLFMAHGAQKLFGSFDATPVETLFSQRGLAGILEFFGGGLVLLGLLTRPVAFLLSGLMAAAYFSVHFPQDFWPILNRGELAALYCWLWLFFSTTGGGRYSMDAWISERRAKAPAKI